MRGPMNRKVFISGPVRPMLGEAELRAAGCEIVLGKNVDDFPGYRYGTEEFIQLIDDADVLMVAQRDAVGRGVMSGLRELQAIVKPTIGVEKIDVKAATELGILVCNSPAPENFIGLAEATVGLVVDLFKKLKLNEAHLRAGGWKEPEKSGALMMGRTVGIIGLGRVGRNVARRLGAWEMNLMAYDPYVGEEVAAPLGVKMVPLEELLRQSDVVTLHVVLTVETRYMIGLKELKMMKPTAYLVNTSRGPVIKEEDLIHAINGRIIAGAALDVFAEEPLPMGSRLREVDATRLILTPHIIGNNPESRVTGHRMAVASTLAVLKGRVPDNLLNPEAVDRWRARFWR